MLNRSDAIRVEKFFGQQEIQKLLKGVEYIILVSPSIRENQTHPIHFTLFLNTSDKLPKDVAQMILEKFASQHNITNITDLFSGVDAVAFASTNEPTAMPMHIYKEDERKDIPYTSMYIIDFEADSSEFKQVKEKSLTGWTYIRE